MDKSIERSLVLGLTRIFSAYGWEDPKNFADKISTIQYGLYHGDALGYKTHLAMLIQAREKDHKWGLFTSTFVYGIQTLLNAYGSRNDLFSIKASGKAPVFKTEIPSENVFKHTREGKEALRRLRAHGATILRYNLVEEYGVDRLVSDLHNAGFKKGTITVNYEEHQPDELREPIYDDGKCKMSTWFAIMPIVILKNGCKR